MARFTAGCKTSLCLFIHLSDSRASSSSSSSLCGTASFLPLVRFMNELCAQTSGRLFLSVSLQSYFFFCLLLTQSQMPTKVLAYSINQHVLNSTFTLKVCVPVYTSLRPIWRRDSWQLSPTTLQMLRTHTFFPASGVFSGSVISGPAFKYRGLTGEPIHLLRRNGRRFLCGLLVLRLRLHWFGEVSLLSAHFRYSAFK